MQKTMRNRRVIGGLLFLAVLVGAALLAGPTQAATSNGPYYAEPAWDQKLPAATRFIVLADWDSQAVLDRETGLVWEQSPLLTDHPWNGVTGSARRECTSRTTGGRKGWRLPSVHELASLVDPSVPSPGPALPLNHPFKDVIPVSYWSVSPSAEDPSTAWAMDFLDGFMFTASRATFTAFVWCVRGGMDADQY